MVNDRSAPVIESESHTHTHCFMKQFQKQLFDMKVFNRIKRLEHFSLVFYGAVSCGVACTLSGESKRKWEYLHEKEELVSRSAFPTRLQQDSYLIKIKPRFDDCS